MPERKAIVVYSGGLDSTVLLVEALQVNDYVLAVHFNYGQTHEWRELRAAQSICKELGVSIRLIDLPFEEWGFESGLLNGDIPDGHYEDESMKKTVVPFRNGIMISIVVGIAESRGVQTVLIAAHAGDHAIYPDCRQPFMNALCKAIYLGTDQKVLLAFPFVGMSKADIVKRGAELDAPIHLTYSCYKGGVQHCGVCGTCVERKEAFKLAGVEDLTEYERPCTKDVCDCLF